MQQAEKHLFLFQMLFLLVKTTHHISVLDVATVASAIGGVESCFQYIVVFVF